MLKSCLYLDQTIILCMHVHILGYVVSRTRPLPSAALDIYVDVGDRAIHLILHAEGSGLVLKTSTCTRDGVCTLYKIWLERFSIIKLILMPYFGSQENYQRASYSYSDLNGTLLVS